MEEKSIVPQVNSENIGILNVQLANTFYLRNLYYRYHWMATGPRFRDVHKYFDSFADTLSEEIDEIGERIRILSGIPVWNPADIDYTRTLRHPDEALVHDSDILREAYEIEVEMVHSLQKAIPKFENDQGTQDVLIEFLRKHEKQAWFLRESAHAVEYETRKDRELAQA